MKTHTDMTVAQFKEKLASGPYEWPGGYPIYFITDDGTALSFDAAKENAGQICEAIKDGQRDGWRVVAAEINWEDASLYCEHTEKRIESAYAEN